jgi:hypothetical protein
LAVLHNDGVLSVLLEFTEKQERPESLGKLMNFLFGGDGEIKEFFEKIATGLHAS